MEILRAIFCVYLLCLASTYFCEWQVFENLDFPNFSPKEKDSWIEGCPANVSVKINGKTSSSRFTLIYYWSVIDWFKKFSCINFMHIFLCIVKYEFCASLACIYLRECRLKENSACIKFCKIGQNSQKNIYTEKLVYLR